MIEKRGIGAKGLGVEQIIEKSGIDAIANKSQSFIYNAVNTTEETLISLTMRW